MCCSASRYNGLVPLPPDSNPTETARRAEKLTKLVAVFTKYKFSSSDVAMLVPDTPENKESWDKLSAAMHIHPPSKKTRLMLVQALRDNETQK